MKFILKNEDKSFQQMLDDLLKGTNELEKVKKEEEKLISKYDKYIPELSYYINSQEIDSNSKSRIKKACELYEKIKKQK